MRPIDKQWKGLAHKVLASCLIDDGAIFPTIEALKSDRLAFPLPERLIWDSIINCIADDTIPTTEAVALRVNGHISPEYLDSITVQFTDISNRQLVYNAEQLREYAILAKLKDLSVKLSDVNSIINLEDTISQASVELSGLLAHRHNRDATAKAVGHIAWQEAEKFQGAGVPTGIGWFDDISGGLWPGMNYWIAAAYKSGKSTLMRNCLLSSALAGHHVVVVCAEGTRELLALDCQAMLATKSLFRDAVPRTKLRLSGLLLKRSFIHNLAIFHKKEIHAIEEARTLWDTLPITIYDTRDGIRDLISLRHIIKRDKLQYGAKSVWIDYSQLFGSGKTLFERQSEASLRFQEMAAENDIALGILTQRNEEGIRGGYGNSYSANVKGGGDAAATADFLLIPSLDHETSTMSLQLKFSRHTSTTTREHLINPSSGLLLGEI